MDTNTIMHIAIAVILVVMLLFIVVFRKQEKRPPNYKALFILGITFIPISISTENYFFMATAAIFIIVGIVNKKKWDKPKKWEELSHTERRLKISLIIVLSLLVIFGLIIFFFVS